MVAPIYETVAMLEVIVFSLLAEHRQHATRDREAAEHIDGRQREREEGIFCGVSSGGAVAAMLRLSKEVENAVIVAIICDRGDRYLSTGIFDAPN